MERHDESLASFDAALTILPDLAEALCNRSAPLSKLFRYDEALASCDRALALKAGFPKALSNRSVVLNHLHRHGEALADCDQALVAEPADAFTHFNRCVALRGLQRFEEALASCDRAIAQNPGLPEAPYLRGMVLGALRRYGDATKAFERALELRPDLDYAFGNLVLSKIRVCDWRTYPTDLARLTAETRAGKPCAPPFVLLAVSDSASDQLAGSRTWVRENCPPAPNSIWQGEHYEHDRIRVAYLSANFHDHAVAYLAAGLFELHDRERYEISAISFGPDQKGPMRSRLVAAFDHFVEVRDASDARAARRLRELEVDIAVDLMGFTESSRPGILAHRPAPIQVNFLGYCGTMGAPYMDYIIADGFVIPRGDAPNYQEKVVFLPDCFQVNDRQREIAQRTPTRAEVSLPEDGFVFCCFSNGYKINPSLFAIWMRLLDWIKGSVLWLLLDNTVAASSLRHEAAARGVDPDRLVFAPKIPVDQHLARYRLADLFVDTLPYNAHTTTSDALWAGLPVLTCAGHTFAGRAAGSLLHAVGLPQLVTSTLAEYEARALELATNRNALAAIRQHLARNRESLPLFDTDRFRRHIEAAYATMWERHLRGQSPESFAVAPIAGGTPV